MRGLVLCGFLSALTGGGALAHHGPPVEPLYDTQNVIFLDGVVTELLWRNPHVRFRIEVTEGSHAGEIWELEMDPLTRMRRTGLSPEFVKPGDAVKVAGIVARHKPRVMALENLLLPDGQEYVGARLQAPLRFGGERLAAEVLPIDPQKIEAARREANGIFRTWVRVRGHGSSRLGNEALTEDGRRSKAEFNRITDEPLLQCVKDGMPRAMFHPTAMEFIDRGDRILLRIEEHELTRTIHMGDDFPRAEGRATPLGHSVGRWEGDTLVVTTTNVGWPFADGDGTPQSEDVVHVERITPSADGTWADYELTSTDPAYLNGSAVRTSRLEWTPGRELGDYECVLWDSSGL
ncbi:MAG TPA: DUF6152 family protein [Gammaproteobacteria bacterium]